MRWHVTLRGAGRIGDPPLRGYNLQSSIEADDPLDALLETMRRWKLDAEGLTRIHVQADTDKEGR